MNVNSNLSLSAYQLMHVLASPPGGCAYSCTCPHRTCFDFDAAFMSNSRLFDAVAKRSSKRFQSLGVSPLVAPTSYEDDSAMSFSQPLAVQTCKSLHEF